MTLYCLCRCVCGSLEVFSALCLQCLGWLAVQRAWVNIYIIHNTCIVSGGFWRPVTSKLGISTPVVSDLGNVSTSFGLFVPYLQGRSQCCADGCTMRPLCWPLLLLVMTDIAAVLCSMLLQYYAFSGWGRRASADKARKVLLCEELRNKISSNTFTAWYVPMECSDIFCGACAWGLPLKMKKLSEKTKINHQKAVGWSK